MTWTKHSKPTHYYKRGVGIIRQVGPGWYFANDVRPEVLGTTAAIEQKGPFNSLAQAIASAESTQS